MRVLYRLAVCCALLMLLPAASARAAPTITEFPISPQDTDPLGITSLANGTTVFAEGSTSDFGAGNLTGSTLQYLGMSGPAAGVVASDGYLWLTEPSAGKIARVGDFAYGTQSAPMAQYSLPSSGTPDGVTAGPDGNVWFTVSSNPAAIGRITPSGTITEYSAGLAAGSEPTGITAGPDGNLWFTEAGSPGAIGKITPSGTITQYTVGLTAGSEPTGITAGPDGNLWFTEADNPGRIGKITPSGTITEYSAGLTPDSQPTGITAGPDGDLWFVESANPGGVGWITPGGAISQIPTPTADSLPAAITQSSANALWFTETGDHGQLGEVVLPPPVTVTDPAFAVGDTSVILAGAVTPGGLAATYHFAWGTTTSYGNSLPVGDVSAGSSITQSSVTQTLTGLTPDTTYHYRVVSSNCGGCQTGTADGADMTFTTSSPPLTTTTGGSATTTGTTAAPQPPQAPQAPVAAPQIGQTAVVDVTAGRVLFTTPGSGEPQPLGAEQNIPLGSVIDARHGHVDITTEISRAGRVQSAAVWGGEFVLGQSGRRGRTTFRLLSRGLECPARANDRMRPLAMSAARAAVKKKKKQQQTSLWSSDSHGRYSTQGNNSVATVRGTVWETVESCRGTLTRVRRGLVSVLDLHTHQTVLVHTGHTFLARP